MDQFPEKPIAPRGPTEREIRAIRAEIRETETVLKTLKQRREALIRQKTLPVTGGRTFHAARKAQLKRAFEEIDTLMVKNETFLAELREKLQEIHSQLPKHKRKE